MLSTFSIVGADRSTGEIGIAVQSKFLSVGAVVPWVRAGVGAIATQAFANTTFGPLALELMATGMHPNEVSKALLSTDEGADHRQFGIVDVQGRSATFSGASCIDAAAGIAGEDFSAQGNCLASIGVVTALATTFQTTRGRLADRFISALRAAQAEGGDKRGQQSAALIIEKPGGGYAAFNDRYVDLRVDDHAQPIEELARILELHKLYFFAPEPQDVIPIDEALGRELVSELQRMGFLPAGVATYNDAASAALVQFMHVENLENRVRDDGSIDRQTLEYLRSR